MKQNLKGKEKGIKSKGKKEQKSIHQLIISGKAIEYADRLFRREPVLVDGSEIWKNPKIKKDKSNKDLVEMIKLIEEKKAQR